MGGRLIEGGGDVWTLVKLRYPECRSPQDGLPPHTELVRLGSLHDMEDLPPLAPRILLEDGPLLAVWKPAGWLTQADSAGHPAVETWVRDYLKRKYEKPGNVYLGVPHRLDRPVTGVMVFARNSKAAARLAEQFRERTVRKHYLAQLEGVPEPAEGELVDWLLKDSVAAHVSVVPPETPHAKEARLAFRVRDRRADGTAEVEVELLTGRMHQIRVQFGSRSWPVCGDVQYGGRPLSENAPAIREAPIALHAWRLELRHPVRYDLLRIEAPLPDGWPPRSTGPVDPDLPAQDVAE